MIPGRPADRTVASSGTGGVLSRPLHTTWHAVPYQAVLAVPHLSSARIYVSVIKLKKGVHTVDLHPMNSCPCRAYTSLSLDIADSAKQVNFHVKTKHRGLLGGNFAD